MKQEESTWQKIEVTKQLVHPKYNPDTILNDIMLLKVPFSFLHFTIPPYLALFLTCTFLILSLPTHFLRDHPDILCHHHPIGEKPLPLPREPLPHCTFHFPWD